MFLAILTQLGARYELLRVRANSFAHVVHFKTVRSNLYPWRRPAGHGPQLHDFEHVDRFVLRAMLGGLQRRPPAVLSAGGTREQQPGVACQSDVAGATLQSQSPGVRGPLSGLHLRVQRQRSQRGDGSASRHPQVAGEAVDVRFGWVCDIFYPLCLNLTSMVVLSQARS